MPMIIRWEEITVLTAAVHAYTYYSDEEKTAISLSDEMFKEIEQIAKECGCSRSHVITAAISEFLERRESRKLLAALNDAYQDSEPPEETGVRQAMPRGPGRNLIEFLPLTNISLSSAIVPSPLGGEGQDEG